MTPKSDPKNIRTISGNIYKRIWIGTQQYSTMYKVHNGIKAQRYIDPIELPHCRLVSVMLFASCVKKRKVRTDDKKRRIRD